jgi:hypothetical protein
MKSAYVKLKQYYMYLETQRYTRNLRGASLRALLSGNQSTDASHRIAECKDTRWMAGRPLIFGV